MRVAVPAGRLDAAVQALGRQTGTSIGIADPALAGMRVRGVNGVLDVGEALKRVLQDSGARARRVAQRSYRIERFIDPPRRPPAAPRPLANVDATGKEPIVVTGTKRDVPLGAYPGGVEIVDGEDVSTAEAGGGTDAIANRIATLGSTHLGPGRNKLFIRGIADSSFVGPTQATVGQYWGNSRITYSAADPNLRLYDIGRVEVLEGPQGTLYGAGSLGGVVRVVPRAPNLAQSEGAAWTGGQLVQHGDAGIDGGLLLNVPLVEDRLAVRAVAYGAVEGGYIDDRGRGLDDVNRVRTLGGRIGVRFAPGDDWTFDVNALGQRIKGDDSQYADKSGDGLSRSSTIDQPFRNDYWLAELVARKRWDTLELTSAVAYAEQYVYERFEGVLLADPGDPAVEPAAGAPSTAFQQSNRVSMMTSEVRLAQRGENGTGWLVGASVFRNRAQVHRAMGRTMALTGVRNTVDEETLYGEGTVAPFDRFTLTLGGRLTHASLSGTSQGVDRIFAFRQDPGAGASRSETRLLPSAALAWRPDAGLTLFARYQQGFRPGGLSVRRDFIQRFDGDRLYTGEAGFRYVSEAFDLSATGSFTRWRSIQADLIDGYGFPATANIGNGRVVSVGLSGRWRPIAGLELDAALYLNDSEVTAPAEALRTAVMAETRMINYSRLPNVADVSGRFGASYQAVLEGGLTFGASGYLRYVGSSTLGIGPVLGQLQGDYADTGMEFRLGRDGKAVTLSLTNLLDTRGNRFALGTPFLVRDQNQITPLRPRTVRLGFEVGF